MDRLRRSFRDSFRRRKDRVPESSKPHQWQSDAEAVRSATCSFPVKYLGCVEVFESRGMHICEEALKVLRVSKTPILAFSYRIFNSFIFFSVPYTDFKKTTNSWNITCQWRWFTSRR